MENPSSKHSSLSNPRIPPDSPAKSRDVWDKLAVVLPFFSALLIAVVGGLFTLTYKLQDERKAAVAAQVEEQRLDRDTRVRELEVIGTFLPYVTAKDEATQKVAILAINELASPRVARVVAELHPSLGAQRAFQQIADSPTASQAEREFAKRTLNEVFGYRLSARERGLVKANVFAGLPAMEIGLIREGYVTSYDPSLRIPVWSAYRPALRAADRIRPLFGADSDPRVPNPVRPGEYRGSGFSRGHMVRASAIVGVGAHADLRHTEAFYMTNVAPMRQAMNMGAWLALEGLVDKLLTETSAKPWVIAGTFVTRPVTEYIGPTGDIAVPDYFYKIIVWEHPDKTDPYMVAFLFPHDEILRRELVPFLSTVDAIEELTNLDFFAELDDSTEDLVESEPAEWFLDDISKPHR